MLCISGTRFANVDHHQAGSMGIIDLRITFFKMQKYILIVDNFLTKLVKDNFLKSQIDGSQLVKFSLRQPPEDGVGLV